MTEPAAPAPKKASWFFRVFSVIKWAQSPDGRKDLGALVAAVTAAYVAAHRAGIL